jgi:hypothetical protein
MNGDMPLNSMHGRILNAYIRGIKGSAGHFTMNESLEIYPKNFEVLSNIKTDAENLQLIFSDQVVMGCLLFTDEMDASKFMNFIQDYIHTSFSFYSDYYRHEIDFIAVRVGEGRFKMIYKLDSAFLLRIV